jgi:hypothetical protein
MRTTNRIAAFAVGVTAMAAGIGLALGDGTVQGRLAFKSDTEITLSVPQPNPDPKKPKSNIQERFRYDVNTEVVLAEEKLRVSSLPDKCNWLVSCDFKQEADEKKTTASTPTPAKKGQPFQPAEAKNRNPKDATRITVQLKTVTATFRGFDGDGIKYEYVEDPNAPGAVPQPTAKNAKPRGPTKKTVTGTLYQTAKFLIGAEEVPRTALKEGTEIRVDVIDDGNKITPLVYRVVGQKEAGAAPGR